jgi:hypothetical protein
MLSHLQLHHISDLGLSSKFKGSVSTNRLKQLWLFTERLWHKLWSYSYRRSFWLRRLMNQLFMLKVFLELPTFKETQSRELMNPVRSSYLDLVTTLRLLSLLNQFIFSWDQLVTKLLPKVSNQCIKAVQFWLTLSIAKLINVAFYFRVKL